MKKIVLSVVSIFLSITLIAPSVSAFGLNSTLNNNESGIISPVESLPEIEPVETLPVEVTESEPESTTEVSSESSSESAASEAAESSQITSEVSTTTEVTPLETTSITEQSKTTESEVLSPEEQPHEDDALVAEYAYLDLKMPGRQARSVNTTRPYDVLVDIASRSEVISQISLSVGESITYDSSVIKIYFPLATEISFEKISDVYFVTYATASEDLVCLGYFADGNIDKSIRLADNTDLISIDENGGMVYPESYFSSETISAEVRAQIDQALEENNIAKLYEIEEITVIEDDGIIIIDETMPRAQATPSAISQTKSNEEILMRNLREKYPEIKNNVLGRHTVNRQGRSVTFTVLENKTNYALTINRKTEIKRGGKVTDYALAIIGGSLGVIALVPLGSVAIAAGIMGLVITGLGLAGVMHSDMEFDEEQRISKELEILEDMTVITDANVYYDYWRDFYLLWPEAENPSDHIFYKRLYKKNYKYILVTKDDVDNGDIDYSIYFEDIITYDEYGKPTVYTRPPQYLLEWAFEGQKADLEVDFKEWGFEEVVDDFMAWASNPLADVKSMENLNMYDQDAHLKIIEYSSRNSLLSSVPLFGDVGDTFQTAQEIAPNITYDQRINSTDDIDMYKLDLPLMGFTNKELGEYEMYFKTSYVFKATGETDLSIRLIKKTDSGEQDYGSYTTNFNNNYSFELPAILDPGIYYLEIKRDKNSDGFVEGKGPKYTLSANLISADVTGDSKSNAKLLSFQEDENGKLIASVNEDKIDYTEDVDWYKVDIPEDGVYRLSLLGVDRTLEIKFVDSSGKEVKRKITTPGVLSLILFKGLNYISIRSIGEETPFHFGLELKRQDPISPGTTKADATALSPNSPIVASIVGQDTTHWFKVTVPSAENSNIVAPTAAGIMSASSTIETDGTEVPCAFVLTGFDTSKLRLSLVNEAEEVIEFKDTANKNGNIRVLLKPGDYYLQVQKMDNFDIPTMYALEFVIGTYDGQDYSFISNLLDFIMSLNDKSDDAASRKISMPIRRDPLVLDLTDTGFVPKPVSEGAYFDLNRDGFAEKINWVSGGNGFLAVDKNGDGKIRNGNELFGDNTVLASGVQAKNGFEALAEFDTNKDGIVDSSDNDFAKLLVWVDANEDGISTSEELKALAEHNIRSLSLNYELKNELTESGAVLANLSTFDREDDSVGKLGELWVISELYNTKDLEPVDLPAELAGLPDIPSIGTVYSLHKAMALDSTGRLAELVRQFAVTYDDKARMEIVEQILLIMTDSENIVSDSRGPNIDAKKLNVVERFLGKPFVGANGSNPNRLAAPLLLEVYNEFCEVYYSELIYQTHLKSLHSLFKYRMDDGKASLLVEDLSDFLIDWVDSGRLSQQMLTDTARFIKYLGRHNISGFDSFRTYFGIRASHYLSVIDQSVGVALIGTDNADTLRSTPSKSSIYGLAGDDFLYGDDGNNTLDGGLGKNYLSGMNGSNNYIFRKDYGINTIYDTGSDATIHFGEGINPEDIKTQVSAAGSQSVEIVVAGCSGKIIINYYMTDVRTQIKWFTFADGSIRSASEFFYTEEISTVEQLKAVSMNLVGNYKLVADIDLEGIEWTPIGTSVAPFLGSFDGNGHVIKNLKVSGRDYSGLFGYIHSRGRLTNIELVDIAIDSLQKDYVGGLAGYSSGLIINCSVAGNSFVKGRNYTGGLVGQTSGSIQKSYTECIVTGYSEVGGLVGKATNLNKETITIIEECYTTGNAKGNSVGGLVGYLDGAKLTNSFSSGNAIGSSYGGGLVYQSSNGEIENCYTLSNTGMVASGTPNLVNSYFNGDILARSISSPQMRTTSEMQSLSTYEDWDFENIWSIEDGRRYPVLKNLPSPKNLPDPHTNIIEISTVEQLIDVSKNLSGNYKLMADIDLSGVTWTPIGADSDSFTGIFDGNGYTIKNMKVSGQAYSGLFGYNQGRLMNIKLADIVIDSLQKNYVGGLAGYSSGLIINCSITGNSSVKGSNYTGGLVGQTLGSIQKSYTECSVTGNTEVGGLVGRATNLNSQSMTVIEECYTTGSVKGNSVGGLVGYLDGAKLTNSFSIGNAIGSSYGGGLVYQSSNAEIRNCYTLSNTGMVGSGTPNLVNSYFNGDILARSISSPQMRTTSEMQSLSTYEDWDFENIWSIEDGRRYPVLKNLPSPKNLPDPSSNVIEISTVGQLIDVSKNLSGSYKLMADIDLSAVDWTPIGTSSTSFTGIFDGNGYVIKNLKISGKEYSGLFGYNQGRLMNIELADVVIDSLQKNYVGGLAGYSSGLIINCSVTGNSLVKGKSYTGGLVGYTLGSIQKSYTECSVEGNTETGGLVGRATNLNSQSVTVIEECYTTGNVKGYSVGGLVGYLNGAKLANSFSAGNTIGSLYAGGLVYVSNLGEIKNCYTLSNAGMVGSGTPSLASSYFNSDMLARTISSAQSRTTMEMKTVQTYVGWDFENIWRIEDGKGYPVLKKLPAPNSNTIEISTAEQLVNVSKNLYGNYKLIADIDLSGMIWIPIGTSAAAFAGSFDGNGYMIKNLKVSGREYSGLFGYTQGRLMNVELADVVIDSLQKSYVGGLAGYNSGLIINCSVTGNSIVKGGSYTGGLVGDSSGSIKKSYTECNVVGGSETGGLAGRTVNINNQNITIIEECYTKGNIVGSKAGGLVGYLNGAKLINSFSTGNAYGSSYGGGLVYSSNNGEIKNCYTLSNTGMVGSGNVNITASYFNGDLLARPISSTQMKTTSEMYAAGTYEGWDLENIWSIEEGKSYPVLKNLPAPSFKIIEISTVGQLMDVSKNLSGNYKLMNDIDLTGINWIPIGTSATPFIGTFNGNGYVINNLKGTGSDYSGLFGYNQGWLNNIVLDDVVIVSSQRSYVGGVVGYNSGLITNCSIAGNSSINGSSYVGGLVGYNNGLIADCSVIDNSSIVGNDHYVGGLVGYAASGFISKSYTECNVKGSSEAGGLVGTAEGTYSNSTVIQECYTSGTVNGYYAGGIVGALYGAQLINCFSVGNAFGSLHEGGLVGFGSYGGIISNCYTLSSTGIVGYGSPDMVSSYFNTDILLKSINAPQGRVTSEMQLLSTYIGWDFENIWSIEEGKSYPVLKNLPAPRRDTVVEIASVEQLLAISENLSGKYKLVADIDLSEINWTPLGTTSAPFSGSLDGNGYLIKNLKVIGKEYSGLFGYSLGRLSNIKLIDITVDSAQQDYVGGLAGYSGGQVTSCSVTGNSTVIGRNYTGGLVGYVTGLINKSYTDCTVEGSYKTGGLIGRAYNDDTPATMIVSECYTAGNVSGAEPGGLIGTLDGAQLVNSFSVGKAYSSDLRAGGLVGDFENGAINNCYTLSNAGMVGSWLSDPDLTSCYFNGEMLVKSVTSSQMKTTSEMQQLSTYEGWDFENVWSIEEGKTYPVLKNLPAPNFNTNVANTVEVSTADQLMAISENLSGNYKLVADIDLAGMNWAPIGTSNAPFAGILDGNGYSIKNLNVSYRDYSGLFGYSQGQLLSIKLVDITVEAPTNYNVGGLVGENSGLINNCSVTGKSSIVGYSITGGLVGRSSGLISNCSVTESVSVVGENNTGGLVGSLGGSIKKSYTECGVEGSYTTGGLVGRTYTPNSQALAIIEECYTNGNVVSSGAGGLVGEMENARLINSYTTSNISVGYSSGGLVGFLSYGGEINNCYTLSNTDIVGFCLSDPDLSSSYINGDLSQGTNSPQSRTTSEMQQRSTYEGWDFVNVWSIEEGKNYPVLKNLPAPNFSINTIKISTAEQLAAISNNLSGNFKLVADIDLAGIDWTPIGSSNSPFVGTLDGNGHSIKNLRVAYRDYSGLFGYSQGRLMNVKLVDITIESSYNYNVGGLIGDNSGLISNCSVSGRSSVVGFDKTGGLVGQNNGEIFLSSVTGNSSVVGYYNTGGLVGYSEGSIKKSYTECKVEGTYTTGGLVGRASTPYGQDTVVIEECYTTRDVVSGEAGGLVGILDGVTLVNSFSMGNVIGGYANGGLVGYFLNGEINNCYTLCNTYVVGSGSPDLSSCYYNGDLAYQTYWSHSRTTSEMQQRSTYVGWDFENVWSIEEGIGYPVLKSLPTPSSSTEGEEEIIEIESARQLADVSKYLSGNYKLVADIDLAGIYWTPIGTSWEPFVGTFDGNGHSIKNLKVSDKSDSGLFGYSQGKLMNINLVDVTIEVPAYLQIFTGYVGGLVGGNYGEITNCSIVGNSSIIGNDFIGGLVGCNSGVISNCFVAENSSVVGRGNYIGGLVGCSEGSIKKSYTECSVKGVYLTGGLVGMMGGSLSSGIASVEECYSKGGVEASEAGGLIGVLLEAKLTNSYSSSKVSGTYGIGGLVANFHSGEITNCYSLSNVAMVGYSALNLANCYFNGDLFQGEYVPQSRTTSEMQQLSTYEGWDFENVWSIEEGMGYPQLRFLND